MNPAVVAQEVATAGAAIAAWSVGGAFALVGAFIYAELAARRPAVGGQYAYLREAFHPLVGVPLRLDAAAGVAERRHGRRGDDLRALLPRADGQSPPRDGAIAVDGDRPADRR